MSWSRWLVCIVGGPRLCNRLDLQVASRVDKNGCFQGRITAGWSERISFNGQADIQDGILLAKEHGLPYIARFAKAIMTGILNGRPLLFHLSLVKYIAAHGKT